MATQIELFPESPFCVRLRMTEATRIFWETYWQFVPKARTSKKCFKRINEFFAGRYVDELGAAEIEAFRRHLAEYGLKANTVNTHHALLTRIYNKMGEWKEAGMHAGIDFSKIPLPLKNPGSQVPKVDEGQFARKIAWSKKTVYRIISAAIGLNDLDLAEIIEMLYMTKLRPGDLWAMTDRNIDLARSLLTGIQHKTITRRLPSGVPYLIAITPRMGRLLARRLERLPAGQALFKAPSIQRFNLVRVAAGAPHVQLRDFRPSAATLLLDNGIDPETVRESLGHTTLRMLPVYAPRTVVHQRRAQAVLEREETEILT